MDVLEVDWKHKARRDDRDRHTRKGKYGGCKYWRGFEWDDGDRGKKST